MTLFINFEAKLEMDQFRFYFFGFDFWFGPELVFFFCVFGLNSFLEVTHFSRQGKQQLELLIKTRHKYTEFG